MADDRASDYGFLRATSSRSPLIIAMLYIAFAAGATLVNLATQEAVVRLVPSPTLSLAIVAGTLTGFIVKYWLDKNWIFFDVSDGRGDETAKIVVYGLFSVLTTMIFWGAELAAWWAFGTALAKYAGAALGLSIGYAIKYMLDRRFVFTGRRP
jgi:putative flippase GtrA